MENNLLLAVFVLLAASVALVPLAKAVGLGTVLGYLAAGSRLRPQCSRHDAMHMAQAFERHDNALLHDSFSVRHDEDAYIGMVRHSMDLLDEAMRGDDPSTIPVDKPAPTRTE